MCLFTLYLTKGAFFLLVAPPLRPTTRFFHAYSICVRRSCGALAGLAVQICAICMAGALTSQPAEGVGGGDPRTKQFTKTTH